MKNLVGFKSKQKLCIFKSICQIKTCGQQLGFSPPMSAQISVCGKKIRALCRGVSHRDNFLVNTFSESMTFILVMVIDRRT